MNSAEEAIYNDIVQMKAITGGLMKTESSHKKTFRYGCWHGRLLWNCCCNT